MYNFWNKLQKPFLILAPMEDVTDVAFREVIARTRKPDVFYTEFVSADGIAHVHATHGYNIDAWRNHPLGKKLAYTQIQKPIVAQLFSAFPERIQIVADIVQKLGFDGIDINMGCPDRSIEKGGCGAAMIKSPELAGKIIQAARFGAPHIPISVKTRIGYSEEEISTWLRYLLMQNIDELTVHLRTRNEMSLTDARWDLMSQVVALRDNVAPNTLIAGNGDAKSAQDAYDKVVETGCDGVMIGRAIFGNPWLFACNTEIITPQQKIEKLIEHIKLFEQELSGITSFAVMKKHFKAYISGWEGAKNLRIKLMCVEDATNAVNILQDARMAL